MFYLNAPNLYNPFLVTLLFLLAIEIIHKFREPFLRYGKDKFGQSVCHENFSYAIF
jgi:hypothetical protein